MPAAKGSQARRKAQLCLQRRFPNHRLEVAQPEAGCAAQERYSRAGCATHMRNLEAAQPQAAQATACAASRKGAQAWRQSTAVR